MSLLVSLPDETLGQLLQSFRTASLLVLLAPVCTTLARVCRSVPHIVLNADEMHRMRAMHLDQNLNQEVMQAAGRPGETPHRLDPPVTLLTSAGYVPELIARGAVRWCLTRDVVHTLEFNDFSKLDDPMLEPALARHGSSLQELSLVGSHIASAMSDIALPRLNTLDLSGCRALMQLNVTAPALQHLTLSRTAVGALELARLPLSSLVSLHLESCKNLDAFPKDPNTAHLSPLPVLQVLNVSNTPLSDANLAGAVAACPALHTLLCRSSRVLKRPHIVSSSLRTVSFSRCRVLTGPVLECTALEELDLSKTCVEDAPLGTILATCRSLRQLDITECQDLAGEACANSPELPHLTHIQAQGSYIFDVALCRLLRYPNPDPTMFLFQYTLTRICAGCSEAAVRCGPSTWFDAAPLALWISLAYS